MLKLHITFQGNEPFELDSNDYDSLRFTDRFDNTIELIIRTKTVEETEHLEKLYDLFKFNTKCLIKGTSGELHKGFLKLANKDIHNNIMSGVRTEKLIIVFSKEV